MIKFLFLIKKGVIFFKRNFKNNITSIISITTILLLLNIIGTLIYSTNSFFNELSKIESIRIYLKNNDNQTITNILETLKKLDGIKSAKYYSSLDAYKILKNNEEIDEYTKTIPPELFPEFIEATIKEKFRDLNYIYKLKENLEQLDGVQKTSIGESWIISFAKIKYSINFFFIILTVFISLSIASIVYNTIKLNMYKFKREIKILSLVGATKAFIIVPIIFSSLIEALISFLLSISMSYLIVNFLINKSLLSLKIHFIKTPDFNFITIYIIFFILLIICFSYISSNSFIKRSGSIYDL
ncbi:permease-like cell division protein FtsX [Deferribacter thermophilus]|uniref:cell division protein FtsX n=1 Tax=Deferribacter thermophilus TaxID=53573 RepID=UPI003C28195E